jgi:hypothetical protein
MVYMTENSSDEESRPSEAEAAGKVDGAPRKRQQGTCRHGRCQEERHGHSAARLLGERRRRHGHTASSLALSWGDIPAHEVSMLEAWLAVAQTPDHATTMGCVPRNTLAEHL